MMIGDIEDSYEQYIGKVTKYAGAKDEIFNNLIPAIGRVDGVYYEPFLGSASVFLRLAQKGYLKERAILSDLNPDVIDMHVNVRDNVSELKDLLRETERAYNTADDREGYYYRVRTSFNNTKDLAGRSPPDRTAQFIFLLRAGYNGVVRYNMNREFNISWSKRKRIDFFTKATPERTFDATSMVLQHPGVELSVTDFEDAVEYASIGDTVYFDPPYFNTMSSSQGHYTPKGFPAEDQDRLKRVFDRLTMRGVKVVEDNADDPYIWELYSDKYLETVTATNKVVMDPTQRGKRTEVIITSTPIHKEAWFREERAVA